MLLLAVSISFNIQLYQQVGKWMSSTHVARYMASDAVESQRQLEKRCSGRL